MIQFALNFHSLGPKDEFFWARQKIRNDSQACKTLVRIFGFPALGMRLDGNVGAFLDQTAVMLPAHGL